MGPIRKIKDYFFRKSLSHHAETAVRGRLPSEIAKVILLLPSLDSPKHDAISQWLRQAAPKATLYLIALGENTSISGENIQILDRKSINGYQALKTKSRQELPKETFDLLINLDQTYNRTLLYVSCMIKANFKIGFLANPEKIYDLLIEVKASSVNKQLEHVDQLLDKIIV